MSSSEMTMMRLFDRIPDEAAAYEYLEQLRWNGTPECPHCGNDDRCYFLNPANGKSRKTRTGAASQRRVWKCGACRKQFSALTGTVMHGTKIPVRVWVFVLYEMCCNKNGIAAREIERRYGMAPRSAWFMTQRVREAMAEHGIDVFCGTVVADETWIGGEPRNRHKGKALGNKRNVKSNTDKTPVLSLIDKNTGQVRSRIVPDVRGHTLRKAIAEQVDMGGSVLHTDAAKHYLSLGREFIAHESVNHAYGEYVRYADDTIISTNELEGFFSQLKRSLDGTHHHVSKSHLHRYLAEFDFRYTTRNESDTQRMARLAGRVGNRRLTYRPLTACAS